MEEWWGDEWWTAFAARMHSLSILWYIHFYSPDTGSVHANISPKTWLTFISNLCSPSTLESNVMNLHVSWSFNIIVTVHKICFLISKLLTWLLRIEHWLSIFSGICVTCTKQFHTELIYYKVHAIDVVLFETIYQWRHTFILDKL